MKTVWQGRLTHAASKYSEHAPMAATCCNACRACVQTNVIAAGVGLLIGAGALVARLFRRTPRTT